MRQLTPFWFLFYVVLLFLVTVLIIAASMQAQFPAGMLFGFVLGYLTFGTERKR